jgi:CheY-like chemotaxis protein
MDQEIIPVKAANKSFLSPEAESTPAYWLPRWITGLWPFVRDNRLAPKPGLHQKAEETRSAGRPGVLVVDESTAVRSLLEWALDRYGFAVWSADGSRCAYQVYRDHAPDIDVVMLDVSTLSWSTTFVALQRLNPRVRLCLMGSDPWPYTLDDLLQFGASAFVQKPFQLDDVVCLLRGLTTSSAVDVQPRMACGRQSKP